MTDPQLAGVPSATAWPFRRAWFVLALIACGGWAGCTTAYYTNSADKEAYQIVAQAEREVFGTTNEFTIDTRHSGRPVDEITAQEIIQDRQGEDALALTIEDALKLAVEHSREYQTAKEQLYLSALSLTGARYQFSPQFLAGSTGRFNRSADGDLSSSVNSQVSVGQFLKSGANLGASIANDFLRFYTGDSSRSVISTLSVNFAQPLLRGAGKSIAAENLKQAERNVIYALRSYSQYQRQFAVDIVLAYFGLLQDKDRLRNAYDDYQRRLETIRYTEARGEAGRQTQLQVGEARSEELSAKNSYIVAAADYLSNLDGFKLTLGLPLTTKITLGDAALEDLRSTGLTPVQIDPAQALQIAVARHLDLLNEIDRFEDSQRQVKVMANRLKPDLNIFGDASIDSEGPTDYTNFDFDRIRAGVGISLDLPIDRLRQRNDYRATLVAFESDIRSLSRALDSKKDQIDRGLRNLERLRRSYFIQTNAVAIAERRVAGEQLSLQAGRRTVRDVRDAQDVLVRSQDSLTDSLVGHLAVKLQLLLDVGVLDTDEEQFWIRAQTTVEAPETAPPLDLPQTDEIIPPDQVFQLQSQS